MKPSEETIKEIISELTGLCLSFTIYKYFRPEYLDNDFVEINIADLLKKRKIEPGAELVKEIKDKFYEQLKEEVKNDNSN